ncbi:NAD(P)/FAD-dependent oxidoreductase [Rhodococcus koreensis]|uniref:NAD(P)/FAD-dependent oxidoreductase n=1 Tax=Rhodococcus koreensis TaxID=99653 RepID=UPI0036721FC3
MDRLVVVGASLAGLRAAETARREGFAGSLVMVGDERHLPYQRPPLSKQILMRTLDADQAALRIDDLDVQWMLGEPARSLDIARREITLEGGGALGFDGLVIATGTHARKIAGLEPDGSRVHVLRSLDDAAALTTKLQHAAHVVVVGGGFIGCEVASACRQLGVEVTIVEAQSHLLKRAVGPEVGDAIASLHCRNGVDLRLGAGLRALEHGVKSEQVVLTDGSVLSADLVVLGLGASPATDWLRGSGVDLDDGVVCDASLRVRGAVGVTAAGDVARWPNGRYGHSMMRLEHWTNASEQGSAAVHTLLADAAGKAAEPFETVPYFWSDQFGVRVQSVGMPALASSYRVIAGSLASDSFLIEYHDGNELVGVVALGMQSRILKYRREMNVRPNQHPPILAGQS